MERAKRALAGRLSALLAGAAGLLGPQASSAAPSPSPPQPPKPDRDAAESEYGAGEQERPTPTLRGGQFDFEVVRPGDTLWSIARRVLGEEADEAAVAAEASRIWRLNADRIGIGSPEVLLPGTVLRLR
jgi:nucleoid-associated protein YgaU